MRVRKSVYMLCAAGLVLGGGYLAGQTIVERHQETGVILVTAGFMGVAGVSWFVHEVRHGHKRPPIPWAHIFSTTWSLIKFFLGLAAVLIGIALFIFLLFLMPDLETAHPKIYNAIMWITGAIGVYVVFFVPLHERLKVLEFKLDRLIQSTRNSDYGTDY